MAKQDQAHKNVWTIRNYKDHLYVAEGVADYFQEDRRASVKILDVAAGTGMLAEQLWKKGFRQLDGLDPSPGMMAEAMKKGVYTNYYLEFMDGHTITELDTDTYDCLVVAAGFNIGLLPSAALPEMVRLVKPGGVMCFGIPDARFTEVKEYINRLEPLMQWMEQDGAWQLLDKKHFEDFYDDANPGLVFRYIVRASDIDGKQYIEKLCHTH
ncbi:methyltransferase-like protein 27 isoform X2 [Haliotis rubra]|uniref:methyltransferase-like protein 27 isoform X2 n=1 Tax=Haliotis rubra TaxID=36100 RepID=UPI001EE5990A|nr:methyltransferase-like protein 27 isoform X2 [Haliotis rubra]